jgi:hypothetical protein
MRRGRKLRANGVPVTLIAVVIVIRLVFILASVLVLLEVVVIIFIPEIVTRLLAWWGRATGKKGFVHRTFVVYTVATSQISE